MNAQAIAERPTDADAGEYVHGVVQAVECLADALNEPGIRAELTGLDALSGLWVDAYYLVWRDEAGRRHDEFVGLAALPRINSTEGEHRERTHVR